MLCVQNVSKSFGGVKAVEQASFEVSKGEITALIGPNGAGKTTVFDIVSGFVRPEFGHVLFDGKSIEKLEPFEIASLGISRTFQLTRLFKNMTVRENLLLALNQLDQKFFSILGKEQSLDDKIMQALQEVELKISPKTSVQSLSYGQKKLVELARALLLPHSLLMLDEPVAGVNPLVRKKISGTLSKFKEEKETVLVIEHDMDFVMGLCDRIIVMDKGKVIGKGKPNEIKKNPQVLEAYLGR